MRTFFGDYKNKNFVYSNKNDAIRAQLISILNTQKGSRFYYPNYGSDLNQYRFGIINYFTIQMIGQCVKDAISLLDGVSIINIRYSVEKDHLKFYIDLNCNSDNVTVHLSIANGVAY